jgi:polyprenyl P-hydroxybenzoate/phenylacrylic acid decarboxylase-like protein
VSDERRRLVRVTRASPLSLVHIRNMETVTIAGATVVPPVLGFYHRPRTADELVRQVAGRVLDQFGLADPSLRRWEGA